MSTLLDKIGHYNKNCALSNKLKTINTILENGQVEVTYWGNRVITHPNHPRESVYLIDIYLTLHQIWMHLEYNRTNSDTCKSLGKEAYSKVRNFYRTSDETINRSWLLSIMNTIAEKILSYTAWWRAYLDQESEPFKRMQIPVIIQA